MSMKTDVVFDYSYEPLRCTMFVHEFGELKVPTGETYNSLKHSMFCFGINPIYINMTMTSHYTTTIELILWKPRITFSIRWWS